MRNSFLFPDEPVSTEISRSTESCPEPWNYSMLDSWTAETEVLEFIYAIVRTTKPKYAVETGTFLGAGAVAIGEAMRKNGFGRLDTIELDRPCADFAKSRIQARNLDDIVNVIQGSSFDFRAQENIDFLFLDSAIDIRGKEFHHFRSRLNPGAHIAFHDTSERHSVVREQVNALVQAGFIEGIFYDTPRGFYTGRYAASVGVAGPAKAPREALRRIAALEEQLADTEARRMALIKSLSWKLTKPLRAFRRLFS